MALPIDRGKDVAKDQSGSGLAKAIVCVGVLLVLITPRIKAEQSNGKSDRDFQLEFESSVHDFIT